MATATVKQQQKKQRKDLKRRKRQQQEAGRKAQLKRACRFPKFEISPGCTAAPEFIDAVYSAARKINFDDRKLFDKLDRLFWESMSEFGIQTVENICDRMNRTCVEQFPRTGDFVRLDRQNKLAQVVYSMIPESIKSRFMPHNHFVIEPRTNVVQLNCHGLMTKPTSQGNIHFSSHSPFLDAGNGKKMLGFTTHALQRICERMAPKWKTSFTDLMRVVRFVALVPSLELIHLHGDRAAIALFADCGNPLTVVHEIYAKKLLGLKRHDPCDKRPEYRLGYCPIESDGAFVVAKTFLPPGYKGTPEYGMLIKSKLPKADRTTLLSLARDHVRDHEQADDWLPLIKWFHNNGVPQVRLGIQDYRDCYDSRFAEMREFTQLIGEQHESP